VSLPGADELFRATIEDDDTATPADATPAGPEPAPRPKRAPERPAASAPRARQAGRQASGRVKHDEKMTVYVTAEELLDIEHARLALRRSLGGAVDRGRLVRAAVAMALADLDTHGDESELVRRLHDA